jgi:hypothetical protein
LQLTVKISGENETPTIANERVPGKEELARILRKATSRGRIAIAMMAFSGLRPESLGDYEGTDGLRLGDIKELKISDEIQFDRIPATVLVKSKLSKATFFQSVNYLQNLCITITKKYVFKYLWFTNIIIRRVYS